MQSVIVGNGLFTLAPAQENFFSMENRGEVKQSDVDVFNLDTLVDQLLDVHLRFHFHEFEAAFQCKYFIFIRLLLLFCPLSFLIGLLEQTLRFLQKGEFFTYIRKQLIGFF